MRIGKICRLFLLALSILTLSFAACSVSNISPDTKNTQHTLPQAASPDKQVLRLPIGSSDFGTLDPALVLSGKDITAVQTIFTGLVAVNAQGSVIDQLAASHHLSSDGLTYTFTLKHNLRFSDGTPLTAKAVAYSINRTLLPATKSEAAYYLSLLKDYEQVTAGKIATAIGDSILVPNNDTVEIIISKPAAYFLEEMTYPCSYVVEQQLINKYGDYWTDHLDEGGGAGPFKVANYSHTVGLDIVPNSNYYGRHPQLQKVHFVISGDDDTIYKGYLAGQFDLANVPPVEIKDAKQRGDYHEYPILAIDYLTMNYLAPPFNNIKIRQAFALALNKDLLAKTVLKDTEKPTNHIVPSGMIGYNDKLTGPTGVTTTGGDPKKAQALLKQGMKEAGYSDIASVPPITFTYAAGFQTLTNLVLAMTQEWQTILGITVKTAAVSLDSLSEMLGTTTGKEGPLQLWSERWGADYPDPQDVLSLDFARDVGDNNNMNYGQNKSTNAPQQQEVQDMLVQADGNRDMTVRLQIYNKAEQQIVDDVGWIPTFQVVGHTLLNPKVQGYSFTTFSPDDWSTIYVAH